MNDVSVIGIDLAKQVFELVALDDRGRVLWRRRFRRDQLLAFMAQQPPTRVGMEACAGAHDWGRRLSALGHEVRLVPMHQVKPFRQGTKNDRNDALAIAEAAMRASLKGVAIKSQAQQDMLSIHRCRQLLMRQRTALINQGRGLLMEYGVVLRRGAGQFRRGLPLLLAEADNGLTPSIRETLALIGRQVSELDERIEGLERRLKAQADAVSRRLRSRPGVGWLTATAFAASVGDPSTFRDGRQVAAWLGLVPRQHSSGDQIRLGRISKRGDRYLRTLLIEGAHSYLRRAPYYDTRLSRWAVALQARVGQQKAAVALANKNARVLWSLMASGEAHQD